MLQMYYSIDNILPKPSLQYIPIRIIKIAATPEGTSTDA